MFGMDGIRYRLRTFLLGACPRLDESTADVLGVARSSDPFRGNVEKDRQLRSRAFGVLTYSVYAPRAKSPVALLDGLFEHYPFSLNSPTIRLKRSKYPTQTSTSS